MAKRLKPKLVSVTIFCPKLKKNVVIKSPNISGSVQLWGDESFEDSQAELCVDCKCGKRHNFDL